MSQESPKHLQITVLYEYLIIMLFPPIFINKKDLAQVPYTDIMLTVYYPLLKYSHRTVPNVCQELELAGTNEVEELSFPAQHADHSPMVLAPSSPRFGQTEGLSELFLHAFT